MTAAIECEGLTKYYGAARRVDDLDLEEERGTLDLLIGFGAVAAAGCVGLQRRDLRK